MVVCMVGADVECRSELGIALKTKTFVVAWQCLPLQNWISLGGITFNFLLDVLALAGDDNLGGAWLIFSTRIRSMARVETRMTTSDGSLGLAARMWTVTQFSVFALSWAMAALLAGMNSALQALLADLATRDGCRPARLVLENLLAAHACLLNKIWTLWT